jgi:DNA-3-methyladenine glycosylase II
MCERKTENLKSKVTSIVRKMLGLDIDLRPFYKLANEDKRLGLLSRRFMGLKPPRFTSVFEALVNGIACQQLSLHVGLILLNRLASQCGLEVTDSKLYSFPTAKCLSKFSVAQFRQLGFSRSKGLAITNLASGLLKGSVRQDSLAGLEDDQVRTQLEQLKGVGRWTAEYALLRGLGRIHIFPGDDVGARSSLKKWLGLRKELDYERVNKAVLRFKPFCGLIYFHLLLDGLERTGDLKS